MAVFVPRAYQHLMRNFTFDNDRCNVFASPGVGKTSSSVETFAALKLFGEVNRALVLAPKRVAETSWPAERVKWKESFGHLSMAACIGSPAQRLAALRSTPDILTINYENIDWLLNQYGDNWPFDMVFADESTRLKGLRVSMQYGKKKDGSQGKEHIRGQGSSRAKALASVAHTKVRRWVNLTGSPAPNGLIDVWGQNWFVDGGRGLGNSFKAFTDRWFRASPGSSREQQRFEPLPYADEQIQRILGKNTLAIDARDWFDIKEPIERHIMIDLPPKARKMYDEMQKELFTWVEEHPLEAFSAGTKSMKCLQLASGSVIYDTDEGKWSAVHDEKIEALKSIVEETNGAPLLVAYQFRADLERILKAFPRAKSLQKNSKATIEAFQRGEIPMLVVHPASAGHGLDLQENCWILVDYSSGFNKEYDEQVIERVGPTRQLQSGKDRAVFRYRLIARDTIEETAVLPSLARKTSVQDALKEAMKRSR
jgi:SNF2 family DNA or RNA helicase